MNKQDKKEIMNLIKYKKMLGGRRMGEVIDINKDKPHIVSELICVKCSRRWIGVRPQETLLKNIECPDCKECGGVIETGQDMEGIDV